MSNRAIYTKAVGGDKTKVVKTTDASGDNSFAVQVIVDQGATALTKQTVLNSMDYITQRIVEDLFPEV
jgi:hypothetical protein